MSLPRGERVGAYEVVAPLGAGGMGEVYRARDARLGREVALKVLPADVARDAERQRRFEQEARATGALNHPNVLAVYDVGEHDGTPYLVAELLEGATLRARLQDGPLPPRKALDYAAQIARGLAAAHAKGIVHRDLKPENLFVTKDGRVKILDFGLAKALGGEVSPTESTLAETEPGAVLGTAGYMAPEQVRGRAADARADLFAFGAVLYEMLAGKRAFEGDSHVERAHAILTREPPELAASGAVVPPAVELVLRRCLEKTPEERFQSAQDLAFALEGLSDTSTSGQPAAATAPRAARLRPYLVALLGVAMFGLGAAVVRLKPRPRAAAPAAVTPDPGEIRFTRVTYRTGFTPVARFADGGRSVVYSGELAGDPPQVFQATVGHVEARAVAPPWTKLTAMSPTGDMLLKVVPEGPDHAWHLARASLAGGAPREVVDDDLPADLGPDGSLLVVKDAGQGKHRIEYPVGTPRLEMAWRIVNPRISPGNDKVAFWHQPMVGDGRGTVELLDLRTGVRRRLGGPYAASEGLAWGPDGTEVWFVTMDRGASFTLRAVSLQGRERTLLVGTCIGLMDVAPDGRALILTGIGRFRISALVPGATREVDLSWLDGSIPFDLTPDGKWLLLAEALEAALAEGTAEDKVYVRRTDGSPAIYLGVGKPLAISPDGRFALISPGAPHDKLALVPTGPGETRIIPHPDLIEAHRARFFGDGKRVLLSGLSKSRELRVWVVDLGGGAPRQVGPPDVTVSTPPSPDGTRFVVVGPGGAVAVSLDGKPDHPLPRIRQGDKPIQWTADGRGLYLWRKVPRHPSTRSEVVIHDLATGTERLWRKVGPPDPIEVPRGRGFFPYVTPDGRAYVKGYFSPSNDVYVVEGLR